MAVVDVIDLTLSPTPSVIVLDDEKDADTVPCGGQDSPDKKNRKQRRKEERDRRERRNQELGDQMHNVSWKRANSLEEDQYRLGEKRKRLKNAGVIPSSRSRGRSLSPLFLIDTSAGSSSSVASQRVTAPTDPAPVEPVVEPHADFPVETPIPTDPFIPSKPPVVTDLLLPPHVTIAARDVVSVPNEDMRLSPSSDASGIDFLGNDYRAIGVRRYFHDAATKLVRSYGPCTRCGDDDHDFKNCPNMICITCGARNEHSSRSCPILRFCWSCKAKGHLAKDCPRVGSMNLREVNRDDCERCGSWKHHGTNCPSLWRIYTYLTDAEREAVLNGRESKRLLSFDNGGEGYIAHDRWCYNCGGSGHLGDDCEKAPNHDRPTDHSAFGSFNELSGPFVSPLPAVSETQRPQREWEKGGRFDDGYGFSADSHVGKTSRENAKTKAREAQMQLEAVNDEPDWFSMKRAVSTNGTTKAKSFLQGKAGLPPMPPPPVIRFGDRESRFSKPPLDSGNGAQPSGSSLRDRIDMGARQIPGFSYGNGRRETKGRDWRKDEAEFRRRDTKGRDWRKDEAESHRRDHDERGKRYNMPYDEPRRDRGSRWHGGYER